MQNTIRSFIAIPLSSEIILRIEQLIQTLTPLCPKNVRWVNPQGIHLTLKFLGDIPRIKLPQISECMSRTARDKNHFEFEVREIGAFPRPEQARVLWVGLEKSNKLITLQKELDQNLNKIGFPLEKRAFSPHLTIARVKDLSNPADMRKIASVLHQTKIDSLGTLEVKDFTLFQSELRPVGAVYSKLFTAQIG